MGRVSFFMVDSKSLSVLACKLTMLIAVAISSYLSMLYNCAYKGVNASDYLAAQVDKIELLKNTPSPRIIFIGGSNLAFSLDSGTIYRELKTNVVNMGLYYKFGLKYMLESVRPYLISGDYIVVVPEYVQFFDDVFFDSSDASLDMFLITDDYSQLKNVRPISYLKANNAIFVYNPFKSKPPSHKDEPELYARSGFNSFGDKVAHLNVKNRTDNMFITGNGPASNKANRHVDNNALMYLANYTYYCNSIGVKSVCVFPCFKKSMYKYDPSDVDKVEYSLRRSNVNLAPTKPSYFMYDDDCFFDGGPYHMNSLCRKTHANRYVSILRDYFRMPE